jgi:DNA polymerase-3 subunit epsilon
MRFVAIDVETANADVGSICQIGLARFADGAIVDEWSSLVDPEDDFDEINVSVHGIQSHMVCGRPTLPEIYPNLCDFLDGAICVCHTHFDRIAVNRGLARYNLQPLSISWLDSARVVRRTWKDLAWKGYGLANVCSRIGYEFQHHDALEDARAAGYVLLAAVRESGIDLDGWTRRVSQPIDPAQASRTSDLHRNGNPEGDLYGEIIVFTGALEVPRHEAADMAASIGCRVDPNVTKRTTILVVGDQDLVKLAGHEKSTKHRKAEQLAAEGHRIRIIRETDFKSLVRSARTATV